MCDPLYLHISHEVTETTQMSKNYPRNMSKLIYGVIPTVDVVIAFVKMRFKMWMCEQLQGFPPSLQMTV